MHVLTSFLHWPDGYLWGNLFADTLTSLMGIIIAYFRMRRHHRAHADEVIRRLQRIEAKLNIPEPALPSAIEEQSPVTPEPFKLVV